MKNLENIKYFKNNDIYIYILFILDWNFLYECVLMNIKFILLLAIMQAKMEKWDEIYLTSKICWKLFSSQSQ